MYNSWKRHDLDLKGGKGYPCSYFDPVRVRDTSSEIRSLVRGQIPGYELRPLLGPFPVRLLGEV